MHLTLYTQIYCVYMPRAICRETCGTDRAGQADDERLSGTGHSSKSASEFALQATQQAGLIFGVCFFVCMLARGPITQDLYCFQYCMLSVSCLKVI